MSTSGRNLTGEKNLETVNKLIDAEIRADEAIELLKRCYNAGHREGWQDGESNAECFAAVNDFLSNTLGNDWSNKTPRNIG